MIPITLLYAAVARNDRDFGAFLVVAYAPKGEPSGDSVGVPCLVAMCPFGECWFDLEESGSVRHQETLAARRANELLLWFTNEGLCEFFG